MNFVDHGNFTIQKEESYFLVNFIGSWNEEAAETFFETFKEIIEESQFKKFGILADLREWEGSTPEALMIAKKYLRLQL